MKAIELLEKQHEEVKGLFGRLRKKNGGGDDWQIFEKLASNLVAHDAIERQVFYPACEEEMGMTEELGEALVEHGVVEFMLYEADQARGKPDFEFKCTVLRELLEHHIEEEESEFFPKVEEALGDERLEELGAKMERAFEKALGEDFRRPLHENLKQVLAGAIKPSPERRGKRRRKPASRSNHARSHHR